MKVRKLLNRKRINTYTIDLDNIKHKTFNELSNHFIKGNINTIVFLKDKKPCYILTPSDLIDVLVNHKDIVRVEEFIEKNPKKLITMCENKTVFEAYKIMREFRIRHLIIVNDKDEFIDVVHFDEFADYLAEIAIRDDLTGLYNRRFFEFVLDKYRFDNEEKGIIFIDLDNFKPINDKFGHDMGDRVLKEVANTLTSSIRASDYAFRIGGDEFVILANASEDALKVISNRIAKKISEINLNGLKVDCSIGYAHYKSDSSNFDEVVKIADKRMYENKRKQ